MSASEPVPKAPTGGTDPLARPPVSVKRIVYLGTPEVAVAPLVALHEAGFEIALVVSTPDRRRGRGSTLMASPVKAAAIELGLPVTDQIADALGVEADLGVVVAFGQLIRPHVLEKLAMVNLHFSLLPRWRGAAPVERALLAGDQTTGICVMALEEGLDTGAIYRQLDVPIDGESTLESLRAELVTLGSALLVDTLVEGLGEPVPQVGQMTYAKKIRPEEYELDWTQTVAILDRQIRLGRAWTTFRGKRFKIWEAGLAESPGLEPGQICGVDVGAVGGALSLVVVQPEGKARMAASDWRNGAQPNENERFG